MLFGFAASFYAANEAAINPLKVKMMECVVKSAQDIRSLQFTGEITRYAWNSDHNTWDITPIVRSFTVLREGPASSKCKIEYANAVTQWHDGAAPFFQEQYSLAYNGVFGTSARYKIGPLGSLHDYNVGAILSQIPVELTAYRVPLGDDALLGLARFQVGSRQSIFDWITNADSQGQSSKVSRDLNILKGPGKSELEIVATDGGWRESIVADLDTGCITSRKLWASTSENQKQQLLSEVKSAGFIPVCDSISIPTSIEYIYYDEARKDGTPKNRDVFSIKDVRINTVPTDAFTIAFPIGFVVSDERVGTRIIVDKDPRIIAEKIKSEIPVQSGLPIK